MRSYTLKNRFILTVVFLALQSITMLANSHQLSTAYLQGELTPSGGFTGELQLRLYDLEKSIGLDNNNNGELLWSEVLISKNSIQDYLRSILQLRRGSTRCQQSYAGQWKVDSHYNEPYLVLPLSAQCSVNGEFSIKYDGFYQLDSNHKLIANIVTNENSHTRVFSNANREIVLPSEDSGWQETLQEFIWQGMLHIWIGIDHILFLLCFLLAAVYSKHTKNDIKRSLLTIAGIISAFTLAHSLTLVATALHWLDFSSRWVEVGIALTVLFSALNNIFSFVTRLAWLTFVFGLLHGMGFAGVLGELGLPNDQKLLSILAFNLGVEFGQIVIVIAVIPLLLALKRIRFSPQQLLSSSSALIAVVAVYWIAERI